MPDQLSFHSWQPFTESLSSEDLDLCLGYMGEVLIGGLSHVRPDEKERLERLREDNFMGQIGELVGCRALFGYEEGTAEYVRTRKKAHGPGGRDKFKGDGGTDSLRIENVDFKASRRRVDMDRGFYWLVVRPPEYRPETVYVLMLVDLDRSPFDYSRWVATVYVMGWAQLGPQHRTDKKRGKFEGDRWELQARRLQKSPTPPLVAANV